MQKVRGFEVVEDKFRKHKDKEIKLPKRGTSKAMAYDFHSPEDVIIPPKTKYLMFTDVKAYMQDQEALILNVRSSMGKVDIVFANSQGWVDSDFYSNIDNDGNIGLFLKNNGDMPFVINEGDRIAQGMFIPFLVADNGNTDNERVGGYGSTNK